ncbi:unnamed product, partial [Ostreococcus tauri]
MPMTIAAVMHPTAMAACSKSVKPPFRLGGGLGGGLDCGGGLGCGGLGCGGLGCGGLGGGGLGGGG